VKVYQMKKSISFDIDGVINDYPKCFLEFYASRYGEMFKSLAELKLKVGDISYREAKRAYRMSDYKYSVSIDGVIKELMQDLNCSHELYILSSRPFDEFPGMYDRTCDWLNAGGIPFRKILPKATQSLNDAAISLHIDDEMLHVSGLLGSVHTRFVVIGEGPASDRITFCADKPSIAAHVRDVLRLKS
jgi:hypothetical protein